MLLKIQLCGHFGYIYWSMAATVDPWFHQESQDVLCLCHLVTCVRQGDSAVVLYICTTLSLVIALQLAFEALVILFHVVLVGKSIHLRTHGHVSQVHQKTIPSWNLSFKKNQKRIWSILMEASQGKCSWVSSFWYAPKQMRLSSFLS